MAATTKADVLSLIEANQNALRASGVSRLGLFGSFVRGDQHDKSDVDILVEFEPNQKTFRNLMQVFFLLQELLQRPIDLVTLESLSPYIRPSILKEVEYVSLDDQLSTSHSR